MDKWVDDVYIRLVQSAKSDADYQELLSQCMKAETDYALIVSTMTEEDRLRVDDYIALCEEVQYRMTRLAYDLGVEDGYRFLIRNTHQSDLPGIG